MGRRGVGEAQGGQTPQVPAALLAIQENQELEELEREQLVIPDGQEEGQGADEEGGCAAPWTALESTPFHGLSYVGRVP